jgi:ribosome-associated protein
MMNEALKIAIKAVDDKKGIDILALDISAVATFTDYFLICSGDSTRQIQAIADEVEQKLAANGSRPAHVEGYTHAEWILMDYLDLVIHIFSRKARAYYDLERLWRDAKIIDVPKLLASAEPAPMPARKTRKRKS